MTADTISQKVLQIVGNNEMWSETWHQYIQHYMMRLKHDKAEKLYCLKLLIHLYSSSMFYGVLTLSDCNTRYTQALGETFKMF